METEFVTFYKSPIGLIEIKGSEEAILSVLFFKVKTKPERKTPDVLKDCKAQLDEYFRGIRKEFDVPLHFAGTDFQKKVWQQLLKIPYGETISYLTLAKQMGDAHMIRAVGGANGKNPISIIVPCHRVIGVDGKLVGYGGGLWRKQWMLEHETKFGGKPSAQLRFDF